MKATIVFGTEPEKALVKKMAKKRTVFIAPTEREAHLYHIEHPEVDSYLIFPQSLSLPMVKSFIQHIHFLNALITVIIFHNGSSRVEALQSEPNVHLINREEDILPLLLEIPEIQRDRNRIQWPVRAQFWAPAKSEEKHWGIILSLSSSGCFIRTEKSKEVDIEDELYMTIHFNDFDFFSEGVIVRRGGSDAKMPAGLAVKFQNTSPQTQRYIQNIIDEKILGELMQKLDPEEGTD